MTGNKKITIEFINSEEQLYPTCGNYFETENEYKFFITKQDDPKKNLLILFHEMVEYALCTDRGISEKEITDFDLEWNKKLESRDTTLEDEPGNEKLAPYYKEHRFSENIERLMALALNIDWADYEKNLII